MINSVALVSLNNVYKTREQKNSTSPIFQGTKKDVFVSTIPKVSKITKSKLEDVFPIYLRYRESANVQSSIAEVKKYLQTEFKKGDDSILVARKAGVPVGFLHYCIERSTLRDDQRIRLKAMFVDEESRGQGVAKLLLENVKEEANGREIIVKARRSNDKSTNLYLTNGFGIDEEYWHLVFNQNY